MMASKTVKRYVNRRYDVYQQRVFVRYHLGEEERGVYVRQRFYPLEAVEPGAMVSLRERHSRSDRGPYPPEEWSVDGSTWRRLGPGRPI